VVFCRATQLSFLRLLTNASVLAAYGSPPRSSQQAWNAYEDLLADDRIVFQAHEPAELELRWRAFTARNTASPHLWMDAYLAAFALAGGYQFVTTDKAFRQFRDLDLVLLGSS
jgi:toxin-antitoxin system PIN domain toxin